MSRNIIYENEWGKEPCHIEIEDKNKCAYLIDEVCCNDKCDEYLGDYPPIRYCIKNESKCKYFEEE